MLIGFVRTVVKVCVILVFYLNLLFTVRLLLTTSLRSNQPLCRYQIKRPDCNYNNYSAFWTSEKKPLLISYQRPISQSTLPKINTFALYERPKTTPIENLGDHGRTQTNKKNILHYYSIQSCLGQKVFAKCSQWAVGRWSSEVPRFRLLNKLIPGWPSPPSERWTKD